MRVIRLDKFIAEKEQVNWLVEGILPDVGWTLFVGQEGIGKTTFAMQLCCALQDGVSFLNRKTVQTNILYFQADSVPTEWREIIKRIVPKGNAGFTGVDVPDKAFSNSRYVDTMQMFIDKLKPGFVVFDSLYNLTGESINTERILVTINMMKVLCRDIPWMLIHHPPNNETRAAGHASLRANCSNAWVLTKTKLMIAKGRIVETKEVAIKRQTNGLWELYGNKPLHGSNGASYMDREL